MTSVDARIESIDARTAKFLREQIEEELLSLAETLGVRISLGKGKYTESNMTFDLEVAVKTETGRAKTREVTDFEALAHKWGLSADDIYRVFEYDHMTYQIIGANRNAPKYPILVRRLADKRRFKFPPNIVKQELQRFTSS